MHFGKGMRWREELGYLLLSSLPTLYYFASDVVSFSLRSEALLTEVNYPDGITYLLCLPEVEKSGFRPARTRPGLKSRVG